MLELFGVNFHFLEFLAVSLALLTALLFIFRGRVRIAHKALVGGYFAAAGLFLASILISSFGAVSQPTALVRGFLKWVEVFGLSAVVFLYCSSTGRIRGVWLLMILAAISSAAGVFYLDFWRAFAGGAFADLPASSVLLTMLRRVSGYDALLVLALVLPFWERHRGIRLLAGLLVALVFLSLSRGGMFILLAVLGYWAWRTRHRTRVWSALGLFIAPWLPIGFLSVWRSEVGEVLLFRTAEAAGFELRMSLVGAAIGAFADRPLTGVGAENFAEYLLQQGTYPPGHPVTENLAPHSLFLQAAAETGILGFIMIVSWFFVVYLILFRAAGPLAFTPWLLGLRLFFLVEVIGLGLFGYVSGSQRILLGGFAGVALASLRLHRGPAVQGEIAAGRGQDRLLPAGGV